MKILLITIISLIPIWGKAHQSHLSVTNIDINDSIVNVQINLAEHDLKDHLYKKNGINFDALIYSTNNIATKQINDYILQNLQLIVNNSRINFEFKNISVSNHDIYIKYEGKIDSNPGKIKILNELLIDYSDEQKNLVIMKYNDLEQGYEFNSDKKEENIEF